MSLCNPDSIDIFSEYKGTDYTKYQNDPIGFCEDILGYQYTDDVKKMMLSVRDNITTLAKSGNATGKTHSAASIAIWFYKCFPGSEVYTLAAPPEDNLKTLLWGEINTILREKKSLFETDTITVMKVKGGEKHFIKGVTIPSTGSEYVQETKFSGKHAPHTLFIVDEGDAVPWPVFNGIESCLSGGHIRLLITFNPRDAVGPVYNKEKNSLGVVVLLSAMNHPNVTTGKDIIPGAVTRDVTVRRINQWTRLVVKDEEPGPDSFDLPKYLEGTQTKDHQGNMLPPLLPGKYIIEEPAFSYMVLGTYPAQSSHQLIKEAWVDAAFERYRFYVAKYGDKPPDNVLITMGFDVAGEGDDENVVSIKYGNMIKNLIFWKGVDTIVSGARGAEIYKAKKAKKCFVDATGLGSGIAPDMRKRGCRAYGIMVASSPTKKSEMGEFDILRDQLHWSFREWLRTCDTAMIIPDKKLKEEALVLRYGFTKKGSKITVMSKDVIKKELRRSCDRLDSVELHFAPERPTPGVAIAYI